jgi:hypothetical protein
MMVIKTTPQILKRVSIRWPPDPALEDTETIALNVAGYYMDLRVTLADKTLQWSRAGERKTLGENPRRSPSSVTGNFEVSTR